MRRRNVKNSRVGGMGGGENIKRKKKLAQTKERKREIRSNYKNSLGGSIRMAANRRASRERGKTHRPFNAKRRKEEERLVKREMPRHQEAGFQKPGAKDMKKSGKRKAKLTQEEEKIKRKIVEVFMK